MDKQILVDVMLYGIKNCDTVKKARNWLDQHAITYRFHDLRKDGLDASLLAGWLKQAGYAGLLNTRSTTWRQLPANKRENMDDTRAEKLLLEYPTLIKRPVLESQGKLLVGFRAETYVQFFGMQ